MIQAGILGATGYAGVELTRLLLRHPGAQVAAVGSVSFEGQALWEVYPSLREICPLVCESADEVLTKSDVVFAALPHGLSQDGSPGFAAFQSAKSNGSSFISPTSTLAPACRSSML